MIYDFAEKKGKATKLFYFWAMELPQLPIEVKKILIAPLNWGLGHATRSVEVIRMLQQKYPDAEIVIASDGRAGEWLKKRFPQNTYYELPGYRIRYPKNSLFIAKMVLLLPRIGMAIHREKRATGEILQRERIDLVVSDNRYGVYSKGCFSVLITHQLKLLHSGWFSKPFLTMVNKVLSRFLRRFNHIWVPDMAETPGLAGVLSHPLGCLPSNLHYIGPLSRFSQLTTIERPEVIPDVFCVVSGPEPQRTIFLNIVVKHLIAAAVPLAVVAGATKEEVAVPISSNLLLYPDLPDEIMASYLKHSRVVLSRSGYSTIMDIYYTGGDPLFIPTPGQTEQEYLAKLHKKLGKAEWIDQRKSNSLGEVIAKDFKTTKK